MLIIAGLVYTETHSGAARLSTLNEGIALATVALLLFGLIVTPAYAESIARKRDKPSREEAREMTRLQLAMGGYSDESIERAMRPRGEP